MEVEVAVSTYTDYCTTVKNTCQNWASLSTTKSSFLPAGEYYWWYFYCVGSNWTEQTCRWCRSWCKMHGDACYKVNSAGQVTQDRCD